jgi:outer membrane lipopolysaccharide assembly protein LptE/RlpB
MSQTKASAVVWSIALVALGGCSDWYLRGMGTTVVPIKSAHVSAVAAPRLRRELDKELRMRGIKLASQKNAQATIELTNESFDRRVLSVDPDSGKVREVELGLEVGFSVRAKDGKLLAEPEKLSWVQDFVFDETSVLGTSERADIIQRELSEDAAQTILLRLETLEIPPL